ncbi:MAG: hypothetical protein LBK60_03715 [Verrucomicrobiales bacterium]|jgi:hypothetical protein|nr:hypothetical protein [Verrucomicrobiales bacterium]
MNKPNLATAAALLAGLSWWQHPASAEPAEPLVRMPKAGSTWTVTIDYSGEKKEAKTDTKTRRRAPQPEKEEEPPVPVPKQLVMKAGKNRITLGVIHYAGGREENFYVVNGNLLSASANSGRVIARSVRASERNFLSLKVEFFPAIRWIERSTYVRTETRDGVECLYFTMQIMTDGSPGTKLSAWVRAADRHPLEIHVDDVVYRVSEIAPFDEAVPLPAEFESVLEHRRAEQTAMDLIRNPKKKNLVRR